MEVTFTKLPGRRYEMAVVRERGPRLAPRGGPGYHDYLPHDAVHFLVEAEARLAGGVFGRIAAGRTGFFTAADPALLRRERRRVKSRKPTASEHADMEQSEKLAGTCQVLWEARAGHRAALPEWLSRVEPEALESDVVARIMGRLDEFARRWHALQAGGSITLEWPLTGRAGGSGGAGRGHPHDGAASRRRGSAGRRPRGRRSPHG